MVGIGLKIVHFYSLLGLSTHENGKMLPNYDKANQQGICLNTGTGTLGFDPV